MTPSQRLRWQDIRALLRLNNELHELPGNPITRHTHMLRGLSQLVGASMGVSAILDLGNALSRNGTDNIAGMIFFVYDGEQLKPVPAMNQYLRTLKPPDPSRGPLIRLLRQREARPTTRTRDQLVGDDLWYRSRHVLHVRRPADVDHVLYSIFPIPCTTLATLVSLSRPWNDRRPMTKWHRRLVHLFHSQVGWLFKQQVPRPPRELGQLSPRQRLTLEYLLAGHSEKQIAALLNRSRHTVHIHVKAIYRAFDVSSRGELLANFVKPDSRLN